MLTELGSKTARKRVGQAVSGNLKKKKRFRGLLPAELGVVQEPTG
jgi:hypothetical protein